jgi:hypothetical protein
MVSHFPHAHPGHEPSPYSPLLQIASFGWLLCVDLPIGSRFTPHCILFSLFLRYSIWHPKWWDSVSPRTPPPALHLTRLPSTATANTWLVVVSSFLSFGHLRPRPSPLLFLMGYASALQMKEPTVAPPKTPVRALYGLVGRCCTKSWGRDGCCHGNRGQSRWGVGWRWIILVGCCVLNVVLWLQAVS